MNRRSAIKAVMLPLAGCWSASTRSISNVEAEPLRARAPDPLDEQLRARAVADDDFVRTVLYTWTPSAQIAKLRGTRRLLVATASTGTFMSPFNRSLAAMASGSHRDAVLARTLATHPLLIRRRYAWPSAFATSLGLGAYAYGSSLVRIELSSDAWIGRFEPSASEPFRFVDTTGADIAQHRALATPERIGALFHVRTERGVPVPFREYVVTNPAMVASWSIATDEIQAELDRERSLLFELGERHVAASEATIQAHTAWACTAEHADTPTLWRTTLAFDGERYQPSPDRLAVIVSALDAYEPGGAPLVSRS